MVAEETFHMLLQQQLVNTRWPNRLTRRTCTIARTESRPYWRLISKKVFHTAMASCVSAFGNTPAAALNTEDKLLADFQRDSHPEKVCLATRGE